MNSQRKSFREDQTGQRIVEEVQQRICIQRGDELNSDRIFTQRFEIFNWACMCLLELEAQRLTKQAGRHCSSSKDERTNTHRGTRHACKSKRTCKWLDLHFLHSTCFRRAVGGEVKLLSHEHDNIFNDIIKLKFYNFNYC